MSFLPVTKKDMDDRGWDQLDFLYISGDAYVDHPSFGHAIITRILESEGYRVGIIPQPNWKKNEDFLALGYPKYGVLISSGVIDSMVNHYTAGKKKRSEDSYSPGGKSGFRPDRALIVYSNKVRELFGKIPVIIGGIEASLRRFAHYDYWDDKVRRSILLDSKADLLIYGMGERPITEIARRLKDGQDIKDLNDVRGTCYVAGFENLKEDIQEFIRHIGQDAEISELKGKYEMLPSYDDVTSSKEAYARAFRIQYEEQDPVWGRALIQKHQDRYLIQNAPSVPLNEREMDRTYSLPYERTYHPMYEKDGGIPAINEVEFSITSHRGCFGGCSFCAINFHQGRIIQKRSQASIINEAKKLTWLPGFKGYIHDVGGPTANFRNASCERQKKHGVCKDRQCMYPKPCKNLIIDHSEYLSLLKRLRDLPGVKKVFIRSGIRYDYLMQDPDNEFFGELCEHHISGQLKVAPEHISDKVLQRMGKPGKKVYDEFVKKYYETNKRLGKEQYLVPYLISGHPGSDLASSVELAEYLKTLGYMPEQVQDFYPTPGTLSTCMYYTEIDPRDMKKVYVPKEQKEKAMQRALLQYRKKENYKKVVEALKGCGREDLIGFGGKCLVKPLKSEALKNKINKDSSKRKNVKKSEVNLNDKSIRRKGTGKKSKGRIKG